MPLGRGNVSGARAGTALVMKLRQGGPAAGEVADALDLAPNNLTFHFDRLREAGLVTVRREGRSMIYAARFEVMNDLIGFLTDNCCQGAACAATTGKRARAKRSKVFNPKEFA